MTTFEYDIAQLCAGEAERMLDQRIAARVSELEARRAAAMEVSTSSSVSHDLLDSANVRADVLARVLRRLRATCENTGAALRELAALPPSAQMDAVFAWEDWLKNGDAAAHSATALRRVAQQIRIHQHPNAPQPHGPRRAGDPVVPYSETCELRALRLAAMQRRLRAEAVVEQVQLNAMPDKEYKKAARALYKSITEHRKIGNARRAAIAEGGESLVQSTRVDPAWARAMRDELTKRRKAFMQSWRTRADDRAVRTKALQKEMARKQKEYSRREEAERQAARMAALKANDMEEYKRLLAANKRSSLSREDDAAARFSELDAFLKRTEEYMKQLVEKVSSVKRDAERRESAAEAARAARESGLSEVAVAAAAKNAFEARMEEERATAPSEASASYQSLAHSIEAEAAAGKPLNLLKPPGNGSLREYQRVGLQWMLGLYNNRLNGILADEMGLGKTVQVMALIAHLMEYRQNYGPHLIIVPNAVTVNWRSELTKWLPDVKVLYYVGSKDERKKLLDKFLHVPAKRKRHKKKRRLDSDGDGDGDDDKEDDEATPLGLAFLQALGADKSQRALRCHVVVTTYDYIMRDRARLSNFIRYEYMVIDEAQRLKDAKSKLVRDLAKFNVNRRLLLTGTPLQNDLMELWSLLHLLLPEVFDDSAQFERWFGSDSMGGGGGGGGADDADGADWLENEKRVVVVHRLHQILEPFMLRRQVQDVEAKLPPKRTITLKCPLSAYQSLIYHWVLHSKTTRLDLTGEYERVHTTQAGPSRRSEKPYVSLTNPHMELRKICNHPVLSFYPFNLTCEMSARSCGKLWLLDNLLVKLLLSPLDHKVLLFSTMTRLLDTVEQYLTHREVVDPVSKQTRKFTMRRIDGGTSLEERDAAIREFNDPKQGVFLFLLSIRAAGRGLNLQTADTVVVYDPDANPKNEEQAVARSHRIGQTREVRVLHLESVIDGRVEEAIDEESSTPETLPYTAMSNLSYGDSIETITRESIQRRKVEMAAEVVDAGRFDGQTTHDERRETLEQMMANAASRSAKSEVMNLKQVNEALARSEDEQKFFNLLDKKGCGWEKNSAASKGLVGFDEVPDFMKYTRSELRGVVEEMETAAGRRKRLASEAAAQDGEEVEVEVEEAVEEAVEEEVEVVEEEQEADDDVLVKKGDNNDDDDEEDEDEDDDEDDDDDDDDDDDMDDD